MKLSDTTVYNLSLFTAHFCFVPCTFCIATGTLIAIAGTSQTSFWYHYIHHKTYLITMFLKYFSIGTHIHWVPSFGTHQQSLSLPTTQSSVAIMVIGQDYCGSAAPPQVAVYLTLDARNLIYLVSFINTKNSVIGRPWTYSLRKHCHIYKFLIFQKSPLFLQ